MSRRQRRRLLLPIPRKVLLKNVNTCQKANRLCHGPSQITPSRKTSPPLILKATLSIQPLHIVYVTVFATNILYSLLLQVPRRRRYNNILLLLLARTLSSDEKKIHIKGTLCIMLCDIVHEKLNFAYSRVTFFSSRVLHPGARLASLKSESYKPEKWPRKIKISVIE